MTEEKSKNTPNLLQLNLLLPLLTALIGLLGLILPLVGYAYIEGYISVFGISGNILERDLSEYWVYSYYITLVGAIKILNIYGYIVLFAILGLIIIFFLVLQIIRIFGKDKLRKFFNDFEAEKKSESWKGQILRLYDVTADDFKKILNVIYYFGIVVLIFVALFAYPFKHGQEQAAKNMDTFLKQGCTNNEWSNCVSISDVNTNIELYTGYLVTSSKKYFAIYDGKKTEVIPRLENYKITRQQNSEFDFK